MKNRKPLTWVGSSKRDLLKLSEAIRRMMGHSLNLAQQEKEDPDSTILTGFGGGNVREITKNDDGGTYRTIYTVKFKEAIYVLHVFHKKSKKGKETPKPEMDLVVARLKEAHRIHAELEEV